MYILAPYVSLLHSRINVRIVLPFIEARHIHDNGFLRLPEFWFRMMSLLMYLFSHTFFYIINNLLPKTDKTSQPVTLLISDVWTIIHVTESQIH